MSIDRSLRTQGSLAKHRNILSRAERIQILKEAGRWDETQSVLGLPKVGHRKPKAGKKKAKAAEGDAAAAPGAAPAAPAGK